MTNALDSQINQSTSGLLRRAVKTSHFLQQFPQIALESTAAFWISSRIVMVLFHHHTGSANPPNSTAKFSHHSRPTVNKIYSSRVDFPCTARRVKPFP
jgi:hypothetical protein